MSYPAKVEVYRRDLCGFCSEAERLLQGINVEFTRYDVWKQPEYKTEMELRNPGARTVPQIFINNQPIGGYSDLAALHKQDELLKLLKQKPDSNR